MKESNEPSEGMPLARLRPVIPLVCVIAVVAFGFWRSITALLQAPSEPAAAKQALVKTGITLIAGSFKHSAVEQTPDAAPEKAEEIYGRAFLLYEQLTDHEKKIIGKPRDEVDEEEAAALYRKLQPLMSLIREAAAIGDCDWGIDSANPLNAVPHFAKLKRLAAVTYWHAAYRMASDPVGSIDDLGIRMRIARHMGNGLAAASIELDFQRTGMLVVRQNLPELDANALQHAAGMIRGFSTEADLLQAWSAQSRGLLAARQSIAAASFEARFRLLNGSRDPEKIQQVAQNVIPLLTRLDVLVDAYAQMPRFLGLTKVQFDQWLAGIHARLAQGPPLEVDAMQHSAWAHALADTYGFFHRARTEREMFSAGLAVLQRGEGELSLYHDPGSGKPFAYRPTGEGFELRSSLMHLGKPVSMWFPVAP